MIMTSLKCAYFVAQGRKDFMTTLRRGAREELRTIDGARISLEETLLAVEIPPKTRLHLPRVEHLLASRTGPVIAIVAESLALPESFVEALVEFGAVYGCPVVPKTSPKEQYLSPIAQQELSEIRLAAIRQFGRSPRFARPVRLQITTTVQKDSYLRVHVHPKRFPAFYVQNWSDRIVFENEHCVVVNKPSGCQVPSRVDNTIECLTYWIQRHLELDTELKPVHRLDTGTEGIVFLAKTKEFAQYFQQLLLGSQECGKWVRKWYKVLTLKRPVLGSWVHFIKGNKVPGMPPRSVIHLDDSQGASHAEMEVLNSEFIELSKQAESQWNLDSAFESLVELKTGRTHQIRVQLAHEGLPIIGDGLYNPDSKLYPDRYGPDDECIGLQAHSLEIFDQDLSQMFGNEYNSSIRFDAGPPWWRKYYRPVMQLGCDLASTEAPEGLEFATFAGLILTLLVLPTIQLGGAFYGLELAFQRIHGVHETMVGYTQGRLPFPIYSIVLTGTTGHVFAVQVAFNPKEVSYSDLLEELFIHVDPTSLNQQRGDEGTFYRSGIYYHNEKQQQDATVKLKELQKRINDGEFRETYGEKIVVEIKAAGDFYVAEEFHQKYFENGGSSGPPQSVVKGCKDPILWDA
eukprot:g4432.t1